MDVQDDLKILYYDPIQNRDIDLPGNILSKRPSFEKTSVVETQGKKELRHFIEEITKNDHWIKKKKDLGLSRPETNQNTIDALCGGLLASNLDNKSNLYPNENPSEYSALIMRVCDYGALAKDRKIQGNLLLHIAKYQELVFVSLCVVMLEIGTPIESVDWMMRRYISDTSPSNLRRLRYGFPRSIQQYGRFAYTKNSYETFVTDMGTPDLALPLAEDGFSPYCLPCFIKIIAGNNKLNLGYSILLISPIYENYFNNAPLDFNPFTHAYSEPIVDFNPFTYAYNDSVVDFDAFNQVFPGGADHS
ncbi:uncharacterized protein N7511_000832 [Penicillium nucicola]|uniref:uncharacterized protein n=1 Tax=Penicillium nucicola TaxID=1850975 RepID=UPI0025459E94|nr:uncharacterized protein N7511_000832 [Penicillium nucicola]KAJ5775821.1 hypothetical protein N7511_000832 [Penicillium nucicola]